MFTVPNEGEVWLLQTAFNNATQRNFKLRLYTAVSPAISETTVLSNFTEVPKTISGESTGYNEITLTKGEFTISGSTLTALNHADGKTPKFTFTFKVANPITILGYYLIAETDNKVILCEAFTYPYVIPGNGSSLTLPINIPLD